MCYRYARGTNVRRSRVSILVQHFHYKQDVQYSTYCIPLVLDLFLLSFLLLLLPCLYVELLVKLIFFHGLKYM